MVAIISKRFRAKYITHEASKLRKSEFFVLLFFLFFSYQHLFYYPNIATSIYIFCNGGFYINIPINILTL